MRSAAQLFMLIGALWCASAIAATTDPMRPLARPGSEQTKPASKPEPVPSRNWVLSSTLVGKARSVAVINDRLVSVGDSILGAQVIGIGARSARLRYAGRELVLHLGEHQPGTNSDAGEGRGAGQ